MHWRKRQALSELITRAVREQLTHVALFYPETHGAIKDRIIHHADGVAPRILDDIGRTRYLFALCKVRKPKA